MTEPVFSVRPMNLADIKIAMKLSMAEGWNQTEKDWLLFLQSPGNESFVAVIDDRVVGTTTAINYEGEVAWIGMVLVDKNHRGLGISRSLLEHIMKKLEPVRSVKLDATPAGRQVYRKLGFTDEYTILRMINSPAEIPVAEAGNRNLPGPLLPEHLPAIIALDKSTFGTSRAQLFNYLLNKHPGRSWVIKDNDLITGFVLGRTGDRYDHVGPLIAPGDQDAKNLLSKALAGLTQRPVIVDVLETRHQLVGWLESIGFVQQRTFTRMYIKENAGAGQNSRLYLIAGPEFG
jgi:GNAT superfamily N-acetyltransferase